jgi:cysteine desulfurase family protein (TIGR01976 family)
MKSLEEIRAEFPALESGFVYFENAGGSQVPRCVIRAVESHFVDRYVNSGATYPRSKEVSQVSKSAHDLAHLLMGGGSEGVTVLGPSSSQLLRMLADGLAETLKPGDEVIVADWAHEANVGPWMRLSKLGFTVKPWRLDPKTLKPSLSELKSLLTKRARVLAFPHVSNVLGEVMDVPGITALARQCQPGIKVVVDGVAYVPHGAPEVAAWNVDWYVYSTYKVFGPHLAAMYGRKEAWGSLAGPNHFWIENGALPAKFELGCLAYESCAGVAALSDYLSFVIGMASGAPGITRKGMLSAYDHFAKLEQPLTAELLGFLRSKSEIRIIGPEAADGARVATVSFAHAGIPPERFAQLADGAGIGIKIGHMASWRLMETLGLDPRSGVVRVSFAHYNHPEEVKKCHSCYL